MTSTEVKAISFMGWSIYSGATGQLVPALGGQFKLAAMVILFRPWVVNFTVFSRF